MTPNVPSAISVLVTLIGVTWRRLSRGRALWVSALIAILPTIPPLLLNNTGKIMNAGPTVPLQFFVMVLLPPVFVASSLGEEIEDRTTTYLWSRPIPRWTVVVGKLLALAPVAMLLVAVGWTIAHQLGTGELPPARTTLGFVAGALAVAAMAAGLATLVPKHGMALSIAYLVILDLAIGALPASIQNISITRHVRMLTDLGEDGSGLLQPSLAMLAISGFWLAIAFWRIRRLES